MKLREFRELPAELLKEWMIFENVDYDYLPKGKYVYVWNDSKDSSKHIFRHIGMAEDAKLTYPFSGFKYCGYNSGDILKAHLLARSWNELTNILEVSTKEKVLAELENPNFPNLKFLFSDEVLDIAPELLKELLEEEKKEFKKLLERPKEEINFDILMWGDDSLSYFWDLLLYLQEINRWEKIDEIIEDFEQDYEDFQNMISYSKDYYELFISLLFWKL